MPLPESPHRTPLHLRRIEMRGYERDDGLYEIDGRVTDTKERTLEVPGRTIVAGEPIHDMWVRLVFDEQLRIHDVVAVSDATPHRVCREAVAPMRVIVGEQIRAGWTAMVKQKLGGAAGCTHLMELLIPLATAAYQTIAHVRLARPDVLGRSGRPVKIDSCYAYASNREVVKLRWPEFYTGAPEQQEATTFDK